MTSTSAPPSWLGVFRNRSFTLLWLAQFVSTMGSSLTAIAASILVYRATGSALSVALVLMVTTAPGLLVGLVAGAVVDRADRKAVLVGAELIRGLVTLAIPLLLPFGVAWLYVLTAASSTVKQFFDPAQASVLPDLADERELEAANAFMTISLFGSRLLGIALAGLLATRFDVVWAFYIDGASFLISGLCLVLLRIPPLPPPGDSSVRHVAHNLRAGVSFLLGSPELRSLLIIAAISNVCYSLLDTLNLPFIVRAVGADELAYGMVESIGLIGFVAGSLLMSRFGARLHDGQWLTLGMLGVGLLGSVYALLSSVPLLIVVNTVYYVFCALAYVARALILQRSTPRELRGRVSSAFFVARDVCSIIGMLLAGLGDWLPIRLLMLAAPLGLLGGALLTLTLPGLRERAAAWRRTLALLRRAAEARGAAAARPATPADIAALARHLPALVGMPDELRRRLAAGGSVCEVGPATRIVRQGEASSTAYFLLDGRTVASRDDGHGELVLEVHGPGDFFGEIAALSGVPRTASVTAELPTTLLALEAAELRQLLADPAMSRLLRATAAERLARMQLSDLPAFAAFDQSALRDLRSAAADPGA